MSIALIFIHQLFDNLFGFEIGIFLVSIIAGCFGSILGLGGGVIIVPALTLLFGINIRYAIGASIVSVIATSSGAAATYVKDHITNVRVAMLLEVATTFGAIGGAFLAPFIPSKVLFIIFAAVVFYSAIAMILGRKRRSMSAEKGDAWATRLKLNSSYPDSNTGKEVFYNVTGLPLGFILMVGAGAISGLLGVGSGVLKVPAMDSVMRLPIKVSSATSNFMIGVTAAASAAMYYSRGNIVPILAAPVALGVLLGSMLGTRLMISLPSTKIRKLFVFVLFVIALEMIGRALGIGGVM